MAEATLDHLNLSGKTPAELEQRRRDIVEDLKKNYKGWDDPSVPTSLLHELAALTSTLRRRTSGPPAKPKVRAKRGVSTTDDLMIDL